MFLSLLKYLFGYLEVSLTGYAPERFLNLCSNHNILIWNLAPTQDGYRFYISIAGFKKLHPILRKTKTKVRIQKRVGIPFFLFRYRKRKLFVVGIVVFAGLVYWLSGFVWKIEVNGNSYLSENTILDFLQEQNCTFGCRKSHINCEALEAELRSQYEDVIWASVQIYGTKMTVSIQENLLPKESYEEDETEVRDIVATKDGLITSMVTRTGTPLVSPGVEVAKGDVLVSGRIELFQDDGSLLDYEYSAADADIYADVWYEYTEQIPFSYEKKIPTGEKKTSYGLRIGSLQIQNPFFHTSFKQENMICDSKQLALSRNFYLPVYFEKTLHEEIRVTEEAYTKEEAMELAKKHFQSYLSNLEEKGVQIIEKNVIIEKERNSYTVKGSIKANESITEYAPTEILEITREERQQSDESD